MNIKASFKSDKSTDLKEAIILLLLSKDGGYHG